MEQFDNDMKRFLVIILATLLWMLPLSFLFSYLFQKWLGEHLGGGLGAIVAGLISYPLARKTGIKFSLWLALSLLVGLLAIFQDWLPSIPSNMRPFF
jgi:hypothetical protein